MNFRTTIQLLVFVSLLFICTDAQSLLKDEYNFAAIIRKKLLTNNVDYISRVSTPRKTALVEERRPETNRDLQEPQHPRQRADIGPTYQRSNDRSYISNPKTDRRNPWPVNDRPNVEVSIKNGRGNLYSNTWVTKTRGDGYPVGQSKTLNHKNTKVTYTRENNKHAGFNSPTQFHALAKNTGVLNQTKIVKQNKPEEPVYKWELDHALTIHDPGSPKNPEGHMFEKPNAENPRPSRLAQQPAQLNLADTRRPNYIRELNYPEFSKDYTNNRKEIAIDPEGSNEIKQNDNKSSKKRFSITSRTRSSTEVRINDNVIQMNDVKKAIDVLFDETLNSSGSRESGFLTDTNVDSDLRKQYLFPKQYRAYRFKPTEKPSTTSKRLEHSTNSLPKGFKLVDHRSTSPLSDDNDTVDDESGVWVDDGFAFRSVKKKNKENEDDGDQKEFIESVKGESESTTVRRRIHRRLVPKLIPDLPPGIPLQVSQEIMEPDPMVLPRGSKEVLIPDPLTGDFAMEVPLVPDEDTTQKEMKKSVKNNEWVTPVMSRFVPDGESMLFNQDLVPDTVTELYPPVRTAMFTHRFAIYATPEDDK